MGRTPLVTEKRGLDPSRALATSNPFRGPATLPAACGLRWPARCWPWPRRSRWSSFLRSWETTGRSSRRRRRSNALLQPFRRPPRGGSARNGRYDQRQDGFGAGCGVSVARGTGGKRRIAPALPARATRRRHSQPPRSTQAPRGRRLRQPHRSPRSRRHPRSSSLAATGGSSTVLTPRRSSAFRRRRAPGFRQPAFAPASPSPA